MLVSSDEIEVACDALWFAKTNGVMDATQQQLFDRLQVIRVGDYGGTTSTKLDVDEIAAIVRALRLSDAGVDLDDDERALLNKLTTELLAAGNSHGTS